MAVDPALPLFREGRGGLPHNRSKRPRDDAPNRICGCRRQHRLSAGRDRNRLRWARKRGTRILVRSATLGTRLRTGGRHRAAGACQESPAPSATRRGHRPGQHPLATGAPYLRTDRPGHPRPQRPESPRRNAGKVFRACTRDVHDACNGRHPTRPSYHASTQASPRRFRRHGREIAAATEARHGSAAPSPHSTNARSAGTPASGSPPHKHR